MANITPDSPDALLLSEIASGNERAFGFLVKRHARMFYRVAYRVTLSREDAEDVVQEAFLKLSDGRAVWDESKGASFTTWFYTVVTRLAISEKRKRRMVYGTEVEMEDASPLPDKELSHRELKDAVGVAMGKLTAPQRAAMELFYYGGLSQKEAAASLGIEIKAYESLLSRAKQQMKKELAAYA